MRFSRIVDIGMHCRPDLQPDRPEIQTKFKISSPRAIMDAQLDMVMTKVMSDMRKRFHDFSSIPTVEDLAYEIYGASNALFRFTWDVEIIQPDARVITTQVIDNCQTFKTPKTTVISQPAGKGMTT